MLRAGIIGGGSLGPTIAERGTVWGTDGLSLVGKFGASKTTASKILKGNIMCSKLACGKVYKSPKRTGATFFDKPDFVDCRKATLLDARLWVGMTFVSETIAKYFSLFSVRTMIEYGSAWTMLARKLGAKS